MVRKNIGSIYGEDGRGEIPPKLVIIVALVAVSFAAIFVRFSKVNPIAIAFYRMFFSTLILSLFLPRYLNEVKSLNKEKFITLAFVGILLGIHFGAWIASLNYTSVASSVVLVTSHPIIVTWISSWYLGERVGKKTYLAILISLIGITLMASSDYSVSGWSLYGDLLAIIGMVAVSGYIILGRKVRRKMSLLPYVFVVYGFSSIFLGITSIAFSTSFRIYPLREYVIFLALALIPTMFGHNLLNWALKHVKARVVSISLLGEPIGSSILAFLILEEVPPTLTIMGAIITLIGIYLSSKYRQT